MTDNSDKTLVTAALANEFIASQRPSEILHLHLPEKSMGFMNGVFDEADLSHAEKCAYTHEAFLEI